MYTVIGRDGEKLKSCKSLISAQKLADKEKGIVLENGKKVYPVENTDNDSTVPYEVTVKINIRAEPSLEAQKIGVADVGMILDAFENLGDWLRIRWNNGEAYARHKGFEYIRKM